VDAVEPGPTTGWMPPETLLEAGAAGTLINHSERKVAWEEMAKSIPRCQKLGLEVIACADDISEAETLAKLSPEYIAIEPPESFDIPVKDDASRVATRKSAVRRPRREFHIRPGLSRAGDHLNAYTRGECRQELPSNPIGRQCDDLLLSTYAVPGGRPGHGVLQGGSRRAPEPVHGQVLFRVHE